MPMRPRSPSGAASPPRSPATPGPRSVARSPATLPLPPTSGSPSPHPPCVRRASGQALRFFGRKESGEGGGFRGDGGGVAVAGVDDRLGRQGQELRADRV